jgi:hypothetical protein
VLPALGEFDVTQTSVADLLATVPVPGCPGCWHRPAWSTRSSTVLHAEPLPEPLR